MSAIITFVQANGQLLLVGGFGLLLFVILFVQISLLRRVGKMQRKINAVTERVGNYLEVIMESDPEPAPESKELAVRVSEEKMRREEEESRIISSMLQEIFP